MGVAGTALAWCVPWMATMRVKEATVWQTVGVALKALEDVVAIWHVRLC